MANEQVGLLMSRGYGRTYARRVSSMGGASRSPIHGIGGDLSLPALIEKMAESEEAWAALCVFADDIMSQKETAEREREDDVNSLPQRRGDQVGGDVPSQAEYCRNDGDQGEVGGGASLLIHRGRCPPDAQPPVVDSGSSPQNARDGGRGGRHAYHHGAFSRWVA
ncbi:hypothetical protein MSG28_015298 [Choristoneura fumiferana]|uniref:Uncharacterized protein n=1 Tax=Choristoneura fumiferana TaxID=7141 RepID=A0ACC0KAJ1_CHOFU|nr:hypothetical protein MSG28_015298 [Choristoneura fumiferana]